MGLGDFIARQFPYVRKLEERAIALEQIAKRYSSQSSGVDIVGGQFDYEYNTKLKGSLRWDVLEEMQNDPHIKGALNHRILPLLSAKWEIQAGSDKAKDKDIADFVAANLLNKSSDKYGREFWLQTSWRQRLFEILDMLDSGFSMFCKTTRPVGAKRVYDRLHWLEPSSVDPHGWDLEDDTDRIRTVWRTYRTPQGVFRLRKKLDAAEISLYIWELKGARYEGKAFIRPMWGAFFRKERLQKYATIWAQKVGAPVPSGSYPSSWPEDVRQKFVEFIEGLRGTSPTELYFVGPQGPDGKSHEVKYAGADAGELDRSRGLIDGENAEIAHAGGTKAMLLGETATGAKAVADPISGIELIYLEATAATVADFSNFGAANLRGEVQELVDWNFAGVKEYPQLVCSKIHPYQGIEHVEGIIKAVQAGVLPMHEALRRQVAERYGLNLPDDAYEVEEPVGLPLDRGKPSDEDQDANKKNGNGDMMKREERALALEVFRGRMSYLLQPMEDAPVRGAGFRRARTRLEGMHVNLAAVQDSFRVGESDMMLVLRDVHWRMLEEIMRRVADGKIDTRNIESQRRSKFRGTEKALELVQRTLRKVADRGADHAEQELKSQREAPRAVA